MKIQQFGKISVFTLDRKFIYLYFFCQTKSIHLELKTSWKLSIFFLFFLFFSVFPGIVVELSTKLFKRDQLFDLLGSMFHISLLSHLFLTRFISFSYFLFFTLYLILSSYLSHLHSLSSPSLQNFVTPLPLSLYHSIFLLLDFYVILFFSHKICVFLTFFLILSLSLFLTVFSSFFFSISFVFLSLSFGL